MKKSVAFFVAAVFLLSAASCSMVDTGEKYDAISETEKNTVFTTAYDFYKSEEDVFKINSKHCTLSFPIKWKDNVETVIYEDESIYKVSFYAVFGSESIPLYNFIFGDSQEGYLLGTVKTDAGEQNVFLDDMSSLYEGQLSENDELTYFEMCEGVNDIISNLVYVEGMTLAG